MIIKCGVVNTLMAVGLASRTSCFRNKIIAAEDRVEFVPVGEIIVAGDHANYSIYGLSDGCFRFGVDLLDLVRG